MKNLYEDAITQVRLPSGGRTQKIPFERGTMQLKEAPSKVMHSLPSYSFSTWNIFYDGSMWEDAATDTRASQDQMSQSPS